MDFLYLICKTNNMPFIFLKSAKFKTGFYWLIKIVIAVLCGVFLYKRLIDFDISGYNDLVKQSLKINWWMILSACLLIFINWGIETVKWKFLIKKIETLSFRKAFFAVMGGVTVSSFTPNRAGEFAGRMMFLKNKLDGRAIALTLIGSMSQLLLTFIFGLPGFLFFVAHDMMVGSVVKGWIKISFIVIPIIYFLIFWNLPFIFKKIKQWFKNSKRVNYLIEGTSVLNFSGLGYITLLSFLRYLIFLSQYIFVLSFFNVGMIWWQYLVFIPAIFFMQTVIPTFAVSEIGVRITAAVFILAFTGAPQMQLIAATTLLWVMNLMLPSLIGAFTILFTKLNNRT